MPPAKINIAIDGHSSTGKSTMAKQLAAQLGYSYVDTGAMYRGVTLYALRNNLVSDSAGLTKSLKKVSLGFVFNAKRKAADLYLNGENVEDEIRTQKVAAHVSTVAALSTVRQFLVAQQKLMARSKGVVMDGRDIGTVVLPEAELKIFMTASIQIRAERRYAELQAKGEEVSLNEVSQNLKMRDTLDSNREDSPLKKAKDARLLDNSALSLKEQLALASGWVKELLDS